MSFEARYEGRCSECGERIHMGDLIEVVKPNVSDGFGQTAYAHVDCDAAVEETDLDRDANKPVCPVCFMVKPCECDDAERQRRVAQPSQIEAALRLLISDSNSVTRDDTSAHFNDAAW